MLRLLRSIYRFTEGRKIPIPIQPVVEPFATRLSENDVKILLDPKGFMSEYEKIHEAANAPPTMDETVGSRPPPSHPQMEPEYGYKPKGPEPTRYGDWYIKGKCIDF